MSRGSLTRYAPLMRDPDPNGAQALAKQKWHADGSIVLLPCQIEKLDWQDRELLNAIGARLYGPRDAKGKGQ